MGRGAPESRYLCTSMTSRSLLPSGFTTLLSASAEPLLTNVSALVQLFPGRRMYCVVAPAFRIAVTAACTDVAQRTMSGTSCGSFILCAAQHAGRTHELARTRRR